MIDCCSYLRVVAVLLISAFCLACRSAAPLVRPSNAKASRPTIAGHVLDASSNPVAGALVAANARGEDAPAAIARSKADGSFALQLPPGKYALTASAPGRAGAYRSGLESANGDAIEVTLTLGTGGVTVSGVVTDPVGHPVDGALAKLSRVSNDEGDTWYAPVDGAGRFAVTLPQARYTVSAIAKGFEATPQYPTEDDSAAHQITVEMLPDDPAGDAVVEQLRAVSVALQSSDPATPTLADMESLAHVIGNAHLVGLGEGTHGGHEIFQLKHRLFRFLVERMGFTVLAIEASWCDTLAIEDYLATGNGDPQVLAAGMRFWIWDTDEVVALLRWMRDYNVATSHPRKLHFVGFDMQSAPTAVAKLRAYFAAAERSYLSELEDSIVDLGNEFAASHFAAWPAARQESAARAVATVLAHLDARRAALVAVSGAPAWARARHCAEILAQFIRLRTDGDRQYDIDRDRFMMQNLDWILQQQPAGTRVALWAHNGHLQKTPFFGHSTLGAELAKRFGNDYVAFSTCFGEGEFRAAGIGPLRGVMEFKMPPPPIGSVEGTLARIGPDIVGVNLKGLPAGSAADRWAHYQLRMRSLGSGYTESTHQSMVTDRPVAAADALFFVRHLTASHFLGPVVRPMPPLAHAANLGFEDAATAPPARWRVPQLGAYAGYRAAVSEGACFTGTQCAVVSRTAPVRMPGYGALEQVIDATPFRGRRVRVRAAVRVETTEPEGGAELFTQSEDAQTNPLTASYMLGRKIRSQRWETYELLLDIPARSVALRFGIAVSGETTAWLDAVGIEPVGDSTPAPEKR